MQDEVKQADREAAARAGLELSRLTDRDADALRQGGSWDEWSLVQAFARHRRQAERETLARMEWRDIESAPRDGSWFTAYWPVQTFEDRVQTTRWLHDDCRFVDASDFMDHIQPIAWMPLPPAPEAA